jgi:hypothetical protein
MLLCAVPQLQVRLNEEGSHDANKYGTRSPELHCENLAPLVLYWYCNEANMDPSPKLHNTHSRVGRVVYLQVISPCTSGRGGGLYDTGRLKGNNEAVTVPGTLNANGFLGGQF